MRNHGINSWKLGQDEETHSRNRVTEDKYERPTEKKLQQDTGGLAEKACSECLATTQISYRRNHFIRVCVQIKLLLFVVVVVQQLGFTASICRAERFLTLPRCSNQTYGCQCSGR